MAEFRILSLDGGGIRGAFTAAFLAKLEEELGRPVVDHFDLIAGTSTGGIIAMALAMGISPARIVSFYKSEGPVIFKRQTPAPLPKLGGWKGLLLKLGHGKLDAWLQGYGLDLDYMLQHKYAAGELQRALKDVFEAKTLCQATTRLVIPSIDLAKGQTVVFKTPHLPGLTRDRHFSAVEVLLATAAAPTYFPHATIRTGSAYCDGGLWANNPSMVAFAEALKIRSCCGRPVDPQFEVDEITMLSVGTGKVNYTLVPAANAKTGLAWWGPKLIDLMGNSQAQGVNFQAEYVLGGRLHRVDFLLPDDSWTLDAIQHVDTLIHCGREKAHEELPKINAKFFEGEKRTFQPFE